mgnify:CR=1 FL=1
MKKGFANVVVWVLYFCALLYLVNVVVSIITSASDAALAGSALTFETIFQYVASQLVSPAIIIGIAEVVRLLTKRIYLAQQYEDVFCDCEECMMVDEDEEAETESSDEANEEETQA